MKQLFTLLLCAAVSCCYGQHVLVNGGPQMAGVDGATYKKTIEIGNGGYYGWVCASRDGNHFYTVRNGKLFFINASNYDITDSLDAPISEISSANDNNILFGRSQGAIYRINTSAKSIVDSIVIPNPWRIQERPNTKELWVASDSNVYIIDYTSALSVATHFKAGISQYDNGDIRFTKGGSIAYKGAPFTKRVYKINASTRVIIDSANKGGFIEVSSDSSKLFVSDAGNNTIYVYQVSNMALTDSIKSQRATFLMFRHPSKNELWAVNHFADSVTVYDQATFARIDSFKVTGSPHVVAFAEMPVAIKQVLSANSHISAYPNPAGNLLHIVLPDNNVRTIIIYDQAGRTVKTMQANTTDIQLNISSFTNGVYYISVQQNGHVEYATQIIKQ